MTSVAVVDYGMGNLRSVVQAMTHVAHGARVELTSDPAVVRRADRVVFPGQGAIGGCMRALADTRLTGALREVLAAQKPFLGICLGLQALYDHSDEGGGVAGLGVLRGQVRRFPVAQGLKVPHMGWNEVIQTGPHPLWAGISDRARFYFVHSYYADSAEPADIAGVTDYGLRFTSAAARDNIFAVQFHPEKSAEAGLRLLGNFMAWDGRFPQGASRHGLTQHGL